jgi:hypothetical protein
VTKAFKAFQRSENSIVTRTLADEAKEREAQLQVESASRLRESFDSIFEVKPLDTEEAARIEVFLYESCPFEQADPERIANDVVQLKSITAEIRAIGRQQVVLIGERIHKARELLKPYRDGTFTQWLTTAFGSRKTAYNLLSYYECYQSLPSEDLREKFKKLPQKAAYVLASRSAPVEAKAEIVREHHNLDHKQLLGLIQERMPVESGDRRVAKTSNDRLVAELRDVVRRLCRRRGTLSEENQKTLATIRADIDDLLSSV